jgi:hypothetical protein
MSVQERQSFLNAVDRLLISLGFTRGAKSREWRKRSGTDILWFHLNFGLSVINPSCGVVFEDLEQRWPDLPGAVYGTMEMLCYMFEPPRFYLMSDDPGGLVDDLQNKGLLSLTDLQDRERVVERLKSDDGRDWPVLSFSHRIRLLPLLLLGLGRKDEALRIGLELATTTIGRDQILPPFDEFLAALREACTD